MLRVLRQLAEQTHEDGCGWLTTGYNGKDAVASKPWEALRIVPRVLKEVMGDIADFGCIFRSLLNEKSARYQKFWIFSV